MSVFVAQTLSNDQISITIRNPPPGDALGAHACHRLERRGGWEAYLVPTHGAVDSMRYSTSRTKEFSSYVIDSEAFTGKLRMKA